MDTYSTITHRLTEIELCRWMGRAAPGERVVYHRGVLAFDASAASSMPAAEREELKRVARRAMVLAQAGLVDLVQRRHGADDYSYIVVARLRPAPTRTAPGRVHELTRRLNDSRPCRERRAGPN